MSYSNDKISNRMINSTIKSFGFEIENREKNISKPDYNSSNTSGGKRLIMFSPDHDSLIRTGFNIF